MPYIDTDWPEVLQDIGAGIFPVDANLQDYDTLIHFWRALAEKDKAIGNCAGVFPEGSTEWGAGLITNIELVAGSARIRITCENDDHTAPNWIDETDGDRKRWLNYTKPVTAGFMPENYRFHADTRDPDHNRMMSADIVDNGDDWVEVANDGRWTLNRTLLSYKGEAFGITGDRTAACHRRHWKERIPPRPNAFEWDAGTITAATATSITDATADGGDLGLLYPKRWPEDLKDAQGNWRDLMTKVNGQWARIAITGIDPAPAAEHPTIKFAALPGGATPNVGEGYWIVDRGAWWRPELRLTLAAYIDRSGRRQYRVTTALQWNFWRWYHGVLRSYWSHNPGDDRLTGATFAADFVAKVILGQTICEEVDVDVYDTDFKVEAIDECNECPDGFFAPDFWYGYRALQIAVELRCSAFCERKVYSTETAIVPFTIATFHRKFVPENTREAIIASVGYTEVTDCAICGENLDLGGCNTCIIDSWANVTWGGGGVGLPIDPITVHWSIHEPDGTIVGQGWIGGASNKPAINGPGQATATQFRCPATDFDPTAPDPNPWVGRKIVISWGWEPRLPYMFKHVHRRDGFLPDSADEGNAVIFPPTELKPGSWASNDGPSAFYCYRDRWGFLVEDGQRPFKHGDAAIFLGDNFWDPTTTAPVDDGPKPAYLDYWDRMWMGIPGFNAPVFQPIPRGTITSGTNFSFTDSDAQWWEVTNQTNADGSSVLHHWTAAGGSSPTMVKITGLASNGFAAVPGYFNDLIIECQVDPTTPEIWEARSIKLLNLSGGPGGDGTFTIYENVPPFSSSTAGRPVRIRQPGYVRNRWIDRKCRFTKPDGTTFTVRGKWSDDKTWYCPQQAFTFEAGWTYEIEDLEPGITVHRVVDAAAPAGEWRLASDAGVVQDTRGANWLPYADRTGRAMNQNLPFEHVPLARDDGGRFRLDDIGDARLVKQLKNAIDALAWCPADPTWVMNGELNFKAVNIIETAPGTQQGLAEAQWNNCVGDPCPCAGDPAGGCPTADAGPPMVNANMSRNDDDSIAGANNAGLTRRYAFGRVTPPCTTLASKASIWVWGQINEADDDPRTDETIGTRVFDANMDPVLFRTWSEFLVDATASTAAIREKKFGSLTLPVWPTLTPTPPGVAHGGVRGYYVSKAKAIIKYNVRPGGMRYLAEID